MSREGEARLGILGGAGGSYGEMVDSILGSVGHNMSREDFLALAWACVDQASDSRTAQVARRALDAIEEMGSHLGAEGTGDE